LDVHKYSILVAVSGRGPAWLWETIGCDEIEYPLHFEAVICTSSNQSRNTRAAIDRSTSRWPPSFTGVVAWYRRRNRALAGSFASWLPISGRDRPERLGRGMADLLK
jgi:hypothetical protein